MKKQLTSMDIRVIRVPAPQKEDIKRAIDKANKITRTALCLCVLPDIYTK